MISEKHLKRHVKLKKIQTIANLLVALGAMPVPSNQCVTQSQMLLDCHQLSSLAIHFQVSRSIRLRKNPRRKRMKNHKAFGASS